jgi:hypothetical protein
MSKKAEYLVVETGEKVWRNYGFEGAPQRVPTGNYVLKGEISGGRLVGGHSEILHEDVADVASASGATPVASVATADSSSEGQAAAPLKVPVSAPDSNRLIVGGDGPIIFSWDMAAGAYEVLLPQSRTCIAYGLGMSRIKKVRDRHTPEIKALLLSKKLILSNVTWRFVTLQDFCSLYGGDHGSAITKLTSEVEKCATSSNVKLVPRDVECLKRTYLTDSFVAAAKQSAPVSTRSSSRVITKKPKALAPTAASTAAPKRVRDDDDDDDDDDGDVDDLLAPPRKRSSESPRNLADRLADAVVARLASVGDSIADAVVARLSLMIKAEHIRNNEEEWRREWIADTNAKLLRIMGQPPQ